MKYTEAMEYIKKVGNFGSNYGLERTKRILELLDSPEKNLKVIHVAGTNGKGSTTAMISEILINDGYKVGMYTSPFIEEFEERIQISRNNIPKEKLAKVITDVKSAVEKVIEEGFNHPTEFEIITCAMFLYFYQEKVDFAVIEVGLGGRLDSTNVVKPILTVITSISFDHTNLLGNTLEEIAKEKAGIIKDNIPLILYRQEKSVFDVINQIATSKSAEIYYMDNNIDVIVDKIDKEKHCQFIKINTGIDKYSVQLPLLGEHQGNNLFLAIKVIEVLNKYNYVKIEKTKIEDSLKGVKWIGRLEVLSKKPLVVIDGAHNIDGIKKLSRNIKMYFNYEKVYLILGILADKQVEEMVKTITPMANKVYAVTPQSDRAELANDLRQCVTKYNHNCRAYEKYEEAFKEAFNDASDNDLIIASGSLYMIGDMRKIITDYMVK